MNDRVKKRIIKWVILPLILYIAIYLFYFQNLESGYSNLDEEEKELFDDNFFIFDIIRIITIIPIFVYTGFYIIYIWYLEKKETKEDPLEPS